VLSYGATAWRRLRRSRRILEQQIRAQRRALDDLLPDSADEGWGQGVVLSEQRHTVPVHLVD
jgi:hypothetical protein